MTSTGAGDVNTYGVWLATRVWALLHEKYGEKVPSVRKIMQDIRAANPGESISHGHVHNILNGDAGNITEKTRRMLSNFFGVSAQEFDTAPGRGTMQTSPSVEAIAFRLSTLRPDELAAIEQIIDTVKQRAAQTDDGPQTPLAGNDTSA